MTPKPEVPLDVPCPRQNCHAAVGEDCWKDPSAVLGERRHTTSPHKVRRDRLDLARADWDRLQEWRASVLAPPPVTSLTEGQPEA